MADLEKPRWRRLSWKRALWIAAGLAALAVVGILFLPLLVPERAVRRQVQEALSARLGRPVTMDSAVFRWGEGLRVGGLRIDQGGAHGNAALMTARQVTVRFDPLEVARTLSGGQMPLESVRMEGLELWLILAKDGTWNFEDLFAGEPVKCRSIQVADGIVHVENQIVGRTITLGGVHASLGELASTGQGYINLSAEPPGAKPSHVLVTANLNSLDLARRDKLAGSFKAEWTDVAWPEIVAATAPESPLARLFTCTSGRMSATFGRGDWTAEGAVQAADLAVGCGPWPDAVIPQAIIGFELRQAAPEKPIEIGLVRFSAPGVALKLSGSVRLAGPAGETAAAGAKASPPPAPAVAASGAKRPPAPGAKTPPVTAAAPEDVLRTRFGIAEADLRVAGNLDWATLCQNVAPLKKFVERFEQLGGGADLSLRLVTMPDGPRLTGTADLTHTVLYWPGVVQKEALRSFRIELDASCARDLASADLNRLDFIGELGRASVKGHVPLAGGGENLSERLAGAWLSVRADIHETERLLRAVPAIGDPLGGIEARGPFTLQVSCEPSAPAWTTKVQADLTHVHVSLPDGARKPAETRATLEALALVTPDARRLDLTSVKATLAAATIAWTGSADIRWPEALEKPGDSTGLSAALVRRLLGEPPAKSDSLTGRFSGTLTVSAAESAGALLVPSRFAADAAPVAGDATLNISAVLTRGYLDGEVKANLDKMAIRIPATAGAPAAAEAREPAEPPGPRAGQPSGPPVRPDYFFKPAGQPASMIIKGLWRPGRPHYVEGEATVDLPGIRLAALGDVQVAVRWAEPAAPEGAEGPKPPAVLTANLEPTSTVELRTTVEDLARAADLVPILRENLGDYRIGGRAESRIVLSLRPRAVHADGNVNLTEAALDLGRYLKKPAGMPLEFDLVGDVLPPTADAVAVNLENVSARLSESVTSLKGRVALVRPESLSAIPSGARLASLLKEAKLEARAEWQHTAVFRDALPWLQPLYTRAGLDGATSLTAVFSGTPVRGEVRFEADATGCRIYSAESATSAETIVKPSGTPAAVLIKARYGEVPGELILDRLELKLADSIATIEGRMLFDDPRLLVFAPPSSWSFRFDGRAPDATALASLFPARLADLKPAGGVTFHLRASADPHGAEIEACDIAFNKARLVWLGKPVLADGSVTYDGHRLATERLNLVAGSSDVTLVAYISGPDREPTGSVFLRGKSLDLKELEGLLRQTSEQLAAWSGAAPGGAAKQPIALSEWTARRLQRLLTRAQLASEIDLERVTLVVPQWNATYELAGLKGEGRLADRRFVVPRFQCALNGGTVSGEVLLDFQPDVPVITVAYDARNLQMQENLKPFVETTFPGMQVFGTLSQRESRTQRLEEKAFPLGRGETILTDGLLEGPGAPEYITNVLPGLKLTQYRFHSMSNDFENKGNGDVDNRMLFNGRNYNIYIFGTTRANGRIDYTLGVDLSVGLGSTVISRTLDQGKLPLLHHTGRIIGTQFAEREISYVPPHEFLYDVFVRRNILLQFVRQIGETPPKIERPLVAPSERSRGKTEG